MQITITEEEREAALTQLGARLDALKQRAVDAKSYERITELTTAIAPIQSVFDKLLHCRG